MEQAIGNGEVVILDKGAVKETRKSLFGFSLPRLPFLERGAKEQGPGEEDGFDQIEATIASVRSIGYGKWEITLENGAKWSTTEAFRGPDPRAGKTLTIRRAALGSYIAKIGAARAVRVKRVE
ncbi:hypothetical protein [Novosphingobium sp. M1R2S20]|uniref:Uncharacterized protein n=1 Tax=Novosphingobium rhizovicinum TaxID=3228928 RepID=A0ABV3R7T9_9SPHN